MRSEPDREQEDDRLNECLVRFEHMLSNDDQYYFDVSDLEELIDHYLEHLDLDKAWKVLELAATQHPHSKEFELRRAEILSLRGDLEGAMRSITILEAIMPGNTDLLITKGSVLSRSGKHEQAIESYLQALDGADIQSDIRLLLSYEYQALNRMAEAIGQIRLGLIDTPSDQGLIHEISFLYDMTNDPAAAIEFFDHFLDEHPYEYNAWYNLATFHINLKQYDRAVWALDLCLAINEDHLLAHQEIGDCYLELEEWDKAEEHFFEVLKRDEHSLDALIGMAECAEGREHFEMAFKRYRNITHIDPFHAEAWYGMAVVREKQERYDDCLPYIEKAIEIDPSDAEYWTFLADLRAHFGEYEAAVVALDMANELNPEDVRIWVEKAQLIFHHIDRRLSVDVMMEALKITPEDAELHYRECAFLLATGHVSEALHYLQNGLELDFDKHVLLFEQFPEAINFPRVMDLIQIYGQ